VINLSSVWQTNMAKRKFLGVIYLMCSHISVSLLQCTLDYE